MLRAAKSRLVTRLTSGFLLRPSFFMLATNPGRLACSSRRIMPMQEKVTYADQLKLDPRFGQNPCTSFVRLLTCESHRIYFHSTFAAPELALTHTKSVYKLYNYITLQWKTMPCGWYAGQCFLFPFSGCGKSWWTTSGQIRTSFKKQQK